MSEIIEVSKLSSLRSEELALQRMLKKEIPRHLGKVALFEELEFNTISYPAQRMDVIGIRGKLASIDILKLIGQVAFNETFNTYLNQFYSSEQTLANVKQDLNNGRKILFLTTHERTDDIAAAFGSFLVALQEFSNLNNLDGQPINSQILISKLISGLGALGGYVPNLLADNLGDILLTLPPSRSVRTSDISREARIAYNNEIKNLMQEDDSRFQKIGQGLIRAVAANGSTFIKTSKHFSSKKKTQMHAAPLASGTIEMMSKHHILPIAVHITGKKPSLKIHALRKPIHNEIEAHQLMDMLIADMTELTGVTHKYYNNREDYEEALR